MGLQEVILRLQESTELRALHEAIAGGAGNHGLMPQTRALAEMFGKNIDVEVGCQLTLAVSIRGTRRKPTVIVGVSGVASNEVQQGNQDVSDVVDLVDGRTRARYNLSWDLAGFEESFPSIGYERATVRSTIRTVDPTQPRFAEKQSRDHQMHVTTDGKELTLTGTGMFREHLGRISQVVEMDKLCIFMAPQDLPAILDHAKRDGRAGRQLLAAIAQQIQYGQPLEMKVDFAGVNRLEYVLGRSFTQIDWREPTGPVAAAKGYGLVAKLKGQATKDIIQAARLVSRLSFPIHYGDLIGADEARQIVDKEFRLLDSAFHGPAFGPQTAEIRARLLCEYAEQHCHQDVLAALKGTSVDEYVAVLQRHGYTNIVEFKGEANHVTAKMLHLYAYMLEMYQRDPNPFITRAMKDVRNEQMPLEIATMHTQRVSGIVIPESARLYGVFLHTNKVPDDASYLNINRESPVDPYLHVSCGIALSGKNLTDAQEHALGLVGIRAK